MSRARVNLAPMADETPVPHVFLRCRCGALVTTRKWVGYKKGDGNSEAVAGHWEDLGGAFSPVLGLPHVHEEKEEM